MKIHKWVLHLTDRQVIPIRTGGRIIAAGLDPRAILCLWAEVDVDKRPDDIELHDIYIVTTGDQDVPAKGRHIATVSTPRGVIHIYDGELS